MAYSRPVLRLVADEMSRHERAGRPLPCIAGVCGSTPAAKRKQVRFAWGYHAALLSMGALAAADVDELLGVAGSGGVIPSSILPSACCGRPAPTAFGTFCEIDNVVAIKIARFQPLPDSRRRSCRGRMADRYCPLWRRSHPSRDPVFISAEALPSVPICPAYSGVAVWTRKAVEQHERSAGGCVWRSCSSELLRWPTD